MKKFINILFVILIILSTLNHNVLQAEDSLSVTVSLMTILHHMIPAQAITIMLNHRAFQNYKTTINHLLRKRKLISLQ